MVIGGWISQVVRAIAMLGIADHLAAGPRSATDLADLLGAAPSTVERLMRAAVGLGLFARRQDGTFHCTPIGESLRSDAEDSARSFALMAEAPYQRRAWEGLAESVRTGQPVFQDAHGVTFWEFLAQHPDDQVDFDAAMAAGTAQRAAAVLEVCDFGDVHTVVDVGGGNGAMLAAVLADHPDVRGVVFDRPEALARAPQVLQQAGVHDRCDTVAGDFLTSVPPDADAYILAQILHDWPDQMAGEILAACRSAMRPGARLWVIERLMPAGGEPPLFYSLLDLSMLVHFGSGERSAEQFGSLLGAAGFTDISALPSTSGWTVIEAVADRR
jgi:hypothetical protein